MVSNALPKHRLDDVHPATKAIAVILGVATLALSLGLEKPSWMIPMGIYAYYSVIAAYVIAHEPERLEG